MILVHGVANGVASILEREWGKQSETWCRTSCRTSKVNPGVFCSSVPAKMCDGEDWNALDNRAQSQETSLQGLLAQ